MSLRSRLLEFLVRKCHRWKFSFWNLLYAKWIHFYKKAYTKKMMGFFFVNVENVKTDFGAMTVSCSIADDDLIPSLRTNLSAIKRRRRKILWRLCQHQWKMQDFSFFTLRNINNGSAAAQFNLSHVYMARFCLLAGYDCVQLMTEWTTYFRYRF